MRFPRLALVLSILSILSMVIAMAAGCAPNETPTPKDQTITGSLALSSFPSAVESVQATRDGKAVGDAVLNADGTFELTLPRGSS